MPPGMMMSCRALIGFAGRQPFTASIVVVRIRAACRPNAAEYCEVVLTV